MLKGTYEEESTGKKDFSRQLICKSLKLLSCSASEFCFFEIFANEKETIISSVIMPALLTPQSQIDDIEDNPTEFVNYTNQLLLSNSYVSPREAFLAFFKSLSTYIDGAVSYSAKLIVEFLNFTVEGANIENLYKYPLVNKITGSPFF